MAEIVTFESPETLARAVAGLIVSKAREVLSLRERFSLALCGGKTPAGIYRLLKEESFASQVEWARIHFFWGDERCVAPNHPESNYRLVRELLIDSVPIPAANVHRVQGELDPREAALDYERILSDFFSVGEKGEAGPVFDLILLGLGPDGHTASLFPGFLPGDEKALVAAIYVEKLGSWRVSLTTKAINAAKNVFFIVTGRDKAGILQRVIRGPYLPHELPAQTIRPVSGRLVWMLDEASASLL